MENNSTCQPWTATRCHRLLRPLLAHIAAWKKESDRKLVQDAAAGTRKRPYSGGSKRGPAIKKARRTYSRRSTGCAPHKSPCQAASECNTAQLRMEASVGPMALPTPFIQRLRYREPSRTVSSSPDQPQAPLCSMTTARTACGHSGRVRLCTKSSCFFETEAKLLRAAPTSSLRRSLYSSVLRALDALLYATRPPAIPQATEATSLVAMCLRKLPCYIAELQWWERHDAALQGCMLEDVELGGSQISFDLYTQLEDFLGAGAHNGWRSLRIVARAHGVKIVGNAIQDGIIDAEFGSMLLKLATQYMPLSECEVLLDAIAVRAYPPPTNLEAGNPRSPPPLPLALLNPYHAELAGGSCGLSARKLVALLSQQLLPSTWLLTNAMGSLWAAIVGDLARHQTSADVAEFITTTILSLSDLLVPTKRAHAVPSVPLDCVQRCLCSALASLASMADRDTVRCELRARNSGPVSISRRIDSIFQSCVARLRRAGPGASFRQASIYLVALAAHLSVETTWAAELVTECWTRCDRDCRVDDAVRREPCMQLYDATTHLLCTMAHNHSRVTSLAPHQHLAMLCDRVAEMNAKVGGLLSNICVDSAFRLSERTGDWRDLNFAESLRRKSDDHGPTVPTCTRPRPRHTPVRQRQTAFAGFRWDEGISEWVTATPAPHPTRASGRPAQVATQDPWMAPPNHSGVAATASDSAVVAIAARPCLASLPTGQASRSLVDAFGSSSDGDNVVDGKRCLRTEKRGVATTRRPLRPVDSTVLSRVESDSEDELLGH